MISGFDACDIFLLLPGLHRLIASLLDFFQFHFLKDKFSAQKLVVGVLGDICLAGFVAAIAIELKLGIRGLMHWSQHPEARRRLGGWSDRQDPLRQIWR